MSERTKERADAEHAMDEAFAAAREQLEWDPHSESFYLSKLAHEHRGYTIEVTVHKPG